MVLGNAALGRFSSLSPRISRQWVCHSQTRLLLNVALQHTRPLSVRNETYALPGNSRSFWWSTSSPKVPPAEDIQEQSLLSNPAADVPPISEQPPAETASLVESVTASETSPVAGTELPSVPVEGALLDPSLTPSIPSPLHYGDLAALGLAGWSPAGLCRWGMELLQVSTGMPWFWTVVSATVISRVILFPFTVKSMTTTARLAPYTDEINDLREKTKEAQAKKDMLGLQSVALKQRMIYEKAGVSMIGMIISPFVQLPVTLGMFFAVKKLCDFPLEQLKYSGVSFLPDLTVADPTYLLPIAATVLMNVQLSLSLRDLTAAPHMAHMVNFFRVLSIASVPLMLHLSSGVLVYLMTSMAAMAVQTLILRQPAVRRALGIPIIPVQHQNKPASFMESYDFAKQWWKEKKAEQEAAIRAINTIASSPLTL
ncbi:hypothetical protein AcW1_002321 [Taiwanofungus camphoratus]|nr:hypothetical protein AcV5_010321 [Antrodia cinnamomea]KAI0944659.1 hypothetical protein AcW1_002321 [Antrodia cinnamomea]KAI0946309.1 hypothetical protein AcV7_010321 [Antrodia cinnamomea]